MDTSKQDRAMDNILALRETLTRINNSYGRGDIIDVDLLTRRVTCKLQYGTKVYWCRLSKDETFVTFRGVTRKIRRDK